MAYILKTLLILRIWVIQFMTCVTRNYMEKGVIPLRTMCKAPCANSVLIPGIRKEVRMILERVMKKEISKLMGINMMM
jgi:hypothetical protein